MAAPRHPDRSVTRATLSEKVDRIALRLSMHPWLVATTCAVVSVLVGVADYFAGVATSMAVFYMVPVMVVAFVFGRGPGLVMACLVAAVNVVADWLQFSRDLGVPPAIALWNSTSRLAISALLVVLVTALREQWHLEKVVARIDATTGVANTRGLFERLRESLASARRNSFPLSVCLFDLDDFKTVNDVHGHAAGDRVLREVAQAAGGALRPGDTVARCGGDEFVLVLPGADESDARAAVARLVETLEAAASKRGVPVTLSAGVMTTATADIDPEVLLKRADELMYEAKRAGKNRIVAGRVGPEDRISQERFG